MNDLRPVIVVIVSIGNDYKRNNEDIAREVIAGIEEEGVLFIVKRVSNNYNAKELAKEASKESILGIGVGISENLVVVNYNKSGYNEAIFSLQGNDKISSRKAGTNAARIVLGKSFKL